MTELLERSPPLLLVDDDPDDRFVLRMLLATAGVKNPLLLCADGGAAVEQLTRIERTTGGVPAAVLLDLCMPRRGGFGVLSWIRSHKLFGDVPVIVVTGSRLPADRHRAFVLGATAFLQKFPSPEDLAEVLKPAVARFASPQH